jgi:hypothetical protein
VGPHWYYDLDELHAAHGPWISDYTTPKPGRYHAGLKAGERRRRWLPELTMKSLAERGGYDEADFCQRMDRDFPADRRHAHGRSRRLHQPVDARVVPPARAGQALGRGRRLGRHHRGRRARAGDRRADARDPQAARHVSGNTALTQIDGTVGDDHRLRAGAGELAQGVRFDGQISSTLMKPGARAAAVSTATPPGEDAAGRPRAAAPAGSALSPDALLRPAAWPPPRSTPDVRIEPAWKVSLV